MSDLDRYPKRTVLLIVLASFFLGASAMSGKVEYDRSHPQVTAAGAAAAGRGTITTPDHRPGDSRALAEVQLKNLTSLKAGVEPACPAAPAPAAARHSEIRNPKSEIRLMRVTAYCPGACCCGPKARGVTASGLRITGKMPVLRIVAADRAIPFGTRVAVPGYGVAVVADRGGAIRGNRLDVLFPTHRQALAWGVRYLDVVILGDGQ